nr:ATP synthase F0 subunit 8 [Empoasca serrata]
MPQMAPVWWLTLMLFFIFTFFMFMCYTYFLSNSSIMLTKSTLNDNLTWLW